MKNKDMLNICYKFFNRFITADELIEQLSSIDKTNLSKNDIEETNKLIINIKKIVKDIPNEEDEYIVKKKENINKLINKFKKNSNDNDNINEFIKHHIENLEKEYEKEIDSQERWSSITNYITKNKYFNKLFDKLTDYELLEFIAQNIQSPLPPNLTQEEFDKLVKVGIEKDEREWLWRLAFNYENKGMNFDEIADYFVNKKDGFYITELISVVGKNLNINNILDKINDKKLIEDLKDRKEIISSHVSDEQFDKLLEKFNNK